MSKREKIKWPETVPFLLPEHIHIGSMHKEGDRNCSCLIAWANDVFWPNIDDIGERAAMAVVASVIRSIAKTDTIPGFNDNHTPAENAKVWNKAMKKLGYTEDA